MIHILLIDSNQDYAAIMKKYLSWHGIDVHTFRDSSTAIDELARNHYDLCVCDCLAQPWNGYSLAKAIRAHPKLRISQIKIFVIGEEEASLAQYKFLRKNKSYFMLKYTSTEKWVEKISHVLQQEDSSPFAGQT